jgi:hypothetical protein
MDEVFPSRHLGKTKENIDRSRLKIKKAAFRAAFQNVIKKFLFFNRK